MLCPSAQCESVRSHDQCLEPHLHNTMIYSKIMEPHTTARYPPDSSGHTRAKIPFGKSKVGLKSDSLIFSTTCREVTPSDASMKNMYRRDVPKVTAFLLCMYATSSLFGRQSFFLFFFFSFQIFVFLFLLSFALMFPVLLVLLCSRTRDADTSLA